MRLMEKPEKKGGMLDRWNVNEKRSTELGSKDRDKDIGERVKC